jgi:tuberculosinol/isotuberculosinol synthase
LISLEEFLQLPTEEVAKLVRASGSKVVVFPINGTRRWFTLEYGSQDFDDPLQAYMDIAGRRHIELYRLFFDHGIDTLITPAFGPDLLLRSDEYVRRVGAGGLARLAEGASFLDFYDEYDVRVHFYGDHRRFLHGTEFGYLSDLFDAASERTSSHKRFHLFFGIFGNDATQTVAEYSIRHFKQYGCIPEKHSLIEMYYGEYVEPVSLFIGFDRFSVFDMPLIATGEEDVYFTVSPSLYMNAVQLRGILHDHLYTRRLPDPEYGDMSREELQELRNFYIQNREYTIGTGKLLHGIWTPSLK